jgi:hypothetical protein
MTIFTAMKSFIVQTLEVMQASVFFTTSNFHSNLILAGEARTVFLILPFSMQLKNGSNKLDCLFLSGFASLVKMSVGEGMGLLLSGKVLHSFRLWPYSQTLE